MRRENRFVHRFAGAASCNTHPRKTTPEGGQGRRDEFLSQCRAQLKAGAAAPSTAAAPAPAPTMHTVPAPPSAQTGQVPAPTTVPAPTGSGEFASEQQARARCPHDTVVWVNTLSHVYHFAGVSSHGRSYYGTTKEGAYMCEADAMAEGNRAARDERYP